MSAFSDPQSVFRRVGQTPCSSTARKYKAAGTTGLFLILQQLATGLSLKTHQLHRECPKGFILS